MVAIYRKDVEIRMEDVVRNVMASAVKKSKKYVAKKLEEG